MITKFVISQASAEAEFGMACQRLVPWTDGIEEPPLGAMACFLPAASDSAPDCHDQEEVMIVLSGTGTIRIGDESAPITTGEMVAIPRNTEHVIHNPTGETLSWFSFYWPLHENAGPGAADPGITS
jgi:mannose-6-phosphate isomerase-like protein (cupin superfamily)